MLCTILLADFVNIPQWTTVHVTAAVCLAVADIKHIVQILFGFDHPEWSARFAKFIPHAPAAASLAAIKAFCAMALTIVINLLVLARGAASLYLNPPLVSSCSHVTYSVK